MEKEVKVWGKSPAFAEGKTAVVLSDETLGERGKSKAGIDIFCIK